VDFFGGGGVVGCGGFDEVGGLVGGRVLEEL
jgi:hypothetical protein